MEEVKKGFLSRDRNKIIVATLVALLLFLPIILAYTFLLFKDECLGELTITGCKTGLILEDNKDEESEQNDNESAGGTSSGTVNYETVLTLDKFAENQGWISGKDYDLNYTSTQLYWKSEDGFLISNGGNDGSGEYSIDFSLYNNCNESTPKYSDAQFEEVALNLGEKIDEKLTSLGLTKSLPNSSESYTDEHGPMAYTLSYEDSRIKCSYEASPQCWSNNTLPVANHLSVTCVNATDFQKNYEEQKPFHENLDLLPANAVSISLLKDDFALLGVSSNYYIGGYMIIAHKEDGKWVSIYAGQDVISCELMHKYKFPKEIQGSCYNFETETSEDNPY